MPAVRTITKSELAGIATKDLYSPKTQTLLLGQGVVDACPVINSEKSQDLSICDVKYPLTSSERATYRTPEGKRVTSHRWAVYDFVRTIPCGRVTTYKEISLALGKGSPRTVGSALRNNPFAPFVPCHRIVASNLYIGGFYGEWGLNAKAKNDKGTGIQCNRKMEMLSKEGVKFTNNGYLSSDKYIWRE